MAEFLAVNTTPRVIFFRGEVITYGDGEHEHGRIDGFNGHLIWVYNDDTGHSFVDADIAAAYVNDELGSEAIESDGEGGDVVSEADDEMTGDEDALTAPLVSEDDEEDDLQDALYIQHLDEVAAAIEAEPSDYDGDETEIESYSSEEEAEEDAIEPVSFCGACGGDDCVHVRVTVTLGGRAVYAPNRYTPVERPEDDDDLSV